MLIENASKSRTEVYIHPTNGSRSLTLVTTNQDATTEESLLGSPVETAHDVSEQGSAPHDGREEGPFPNIPTGSMNDIPEDGEQERESHSSDIRMIQAFQARGQSLLESQSYEDAEKAFSNCLKMYEVLPVESSPSSPIVQAQLGLATAFMHQEKWEQAKDLFTFLKQDEGIVRAESLYHLAQIYLAEHDFDNAYTACLEARVEFQSVTECSQCTSLLVLIAQTNEDEAAAAIFADGLQEDEPSFWTTLPFYRFTSKGHGLSISAEQQALKVMEIATEGLSYLHPGTDLIELSFNGHLEAVKILLWRGAPLNRISTRQFHNRPITALMAAASKGHTKIMEALLRAGADPDIGSHNYKNKPGHLPISDSAMAFAIQSQNASAVRLILEATSPNIGAYENAIRLAIYHDADGALEVLLAHEKIRKLIKEGRIRQAGDESILHFAIRENADNMVRKLIVAGFKATPEDYAQAHKSGGTELTGEVFEAMKSVSATRE